MFHLQNFNKNNLFSSILISLLIILFFSTIVILIIKFIKKDKFEDVVKSNVIIGGCARNCAEHLPSVLNKIKQLSNNKNVYFIFYENNSNDNTNKILQNFVNQINENSLNSKAHLISEKLNISRRTPRIAYCRNQILKFIFDNNLDKKYEYFINLDLDNVNVNLNIKSVNKCLNESNNWDIASINQNKKYYDLWALRTNYKNNNCWNNDICIRYKLSDWFKDNKNLYKSRIIPKNLSYIPVLSAFGGFTIYKTNILKNSWYSGEDEKNKNVDDCEHVNFHKKILNNYPNTRFYIIPYMTND